MVRPILMLSIWLLVAVACVAQPTSPPPVHNSSVMTADPRIGTWRIPPDALSRQRPGVVSMPGIERFLYDGTTVTLYLFTDKEWMWHPPDHTYRLQARWVGDELQCRLPFGDWTKLATFAGGRFEEPGNGDEPAWVFERVTESMKDAGDRVLDQPRPLHDYTIKPRDRYIP